MRKMLIATGVAVLCVSPAFAGPKDQTKDSLIGPQAISGNATVNNATTAFTMQAKGCKIQIKAKGLAGVSDGDVIICVAGADVIASPLPVAPGAGNGIVLLGEIKSGGLGIKADLTEIGCGSADQINFNGALSCYLDDANYLATVTMPPYPAGSWQEDCNTNFTAPVAPAPNCVSNPTCAKLKVNNTLPVILGLCQGLSSASLGDRLAGPPSALIATRGSRGFPAP
jgi:hypothetical protein